MSQENLSIGDGFSSEPPPTPLADSVGTTGGAGKAGESGRRKRWPMLLGDACIVVVIVAIALWHLPQPWFVDYCVSWVRGANGSFLSEPTTPASSGPFEAQLATTNASHNMSSSSCSSVMGTSRIACRRLAVYNRSDHLMMYRVSDALVEQLKKLPYVQQIDYYPPGSEPKTGGLLPDVTIVLELNDVQESGLLSDTLEAVIFITAGNRSANSNYFVHEAHRSPPILDL